MITDPVVARRVSCAVRKGVGVWEECDGLNCFAASKASSGDFAAMLFGVGMPYCAGPRVGESW